LHAKIGRRILQGSAHATAHQKTKSRAGWQLEKVIACKKISDVCCQWAHSKSGSSPALCSSWKQMHMHMQKRKQTRKQRRGTCRQALGIIIIIIVIG